LSETDQLSNVSERLEQEKASPAVTVREFLSWFGAQRRGYYIVQRIREALEEAKLETQPDFESAYIDSFITFSRAPETPPEAAAAAPTAEATASFCISISNAGAPMPDPSYADPTYHISKLSSANTFPQSVAPDASLKETVTLMLSNDFSQIPVMIGEREVKGVVSWSSIGERLTMGKNGSTAREFMNPPQEIRADASLFQAIATIAAHQYVLVRTNDNRIAGIVTASDLNLQFQQLAEPFLLLGEIENHIRRVIGQKFSVPDLESVRDVADPAREVKGVADLTFGEYIRLLEKPERWQQLNVPIDRSTFIKQLDRVREIRNDVMHFDPDGIPPEDLERLRDFARFLRKLKRIGVT
jgi:hypothetical protein